jgi:hypothetical protein
MIMGTGRWLISAILLLIRAIFKLTVIKCDHSMSSPTIGGSKASAYVESCLNVHVKMHLCTIYLIFTSIPIEWVHRYVVLLTFKGKRLSPPSTPPAPPSSPSGNEEESVPADNRRVASTRPVPIDWKVSHIHVVFDYEAVVSHIPVVGFFHRIFKRILSKYF